ncbi:type II secretion system protein GspC [Thalassotalea euphylliae]|uniref:Type II secretion system protein GspC n=1 Tax=Thalassotalea euphylliae TaxID=1655234 RepID=A0A3E0U3M7_9GAMM|nr:type II secretion system protein GspC [Thalassotalea euphylliae]REL31581.1 type II secretion system protein GspC [Thalassotalea euphylliae]
MQLPDNLASFSEYFNKLPQVQIAKAISLIILLYIAYLLAQITWQLVPIEQTPTISIQDSPSSQSSSSPSRFNVERFISLNIFGQYNTEQVVEALPEVQDAPETKLNLTLSGVVAASDPKKAAAIIEHNGKQQTYGVGDKIINTRAQLHQVYADRVILKQSGRVETLMLDGFDYNKQPKPSVIKASSNRDKNRASSTKSRPNRSTVKRGQAVDQRNNAELSKAMKALKTDIASNPGKLSDYLKISPKRAQGKIQGYRLMPGKDPAFFRASGLKSGDVAVQMNGLDLSIPSESAQALKLLRETSDLALLVDRNGELTEILFSIAP